MALRVGRGRPWSTFICSTCKPESALLVPPCDPVGRNEKLDNSFVPMPIGLTRIHLRLYSGHPPNSGGTIEGQNPGIKGRGRAKGQIFQIYHSWS